MARVKSMTRTREEQLSADEIRDLQEAAWKETFRYALDRSPFYRRHLRQAGFDEHSSPALADLARIPTVNKDLLSSQVDDFLCVPRRAIIDIVTTSGSTGHPLVVPLSERDLQRLGHNEYLSFRCAGLTPDDTVLLAVTLDRCFIAGMAYYLGLRELGCTIVRVGPAAPAMHLDLLQRTGPTAIVGVPSFLCRIAETAQQAGVDLRQHTIRKAICIGESIRLTDGAPNRVGARIESAWGARVYSTYGITELAASLCECDAGRGGHLHPELLYLEALDDAGNPVPDGEVGELTATTFGVEAMPLLRYRTGDCAAIDRRPCVCGRQTLRIGPIVGRKGQKLKLKGTTLFPSNLQSVLAAVDGVTAYVIVARRGEDLSDHVEVRVACRREPDAVLRDLRERFRGEIKVVPEIRVATAAEIEALQMPDGARKRRVFVDERGAAQGGGVPAFHASTDIG